MIKNRFTEGKIKDFAPQYFSKPLFIKSNSRFWLAEKKNHSTALLTLDQSTFDSSSHSSVNVALLHALFCQQFQFFVPF